MKEIVGWTSAFVVVPTFGLQAYKQWKERHQYAPATTLWLFILALLGCIGQITYSWMLGNWFFL
jgi:MtN3 and saliva related transmembrane protein